MMHGQKNIKLRFRLVHVGYRDDPVPCMSNHAKTRV